MIQGIKLKSFQAHEDTSLALHPGVNVIVGTSDSGKSSILRALRWAVENRPSGDGLRSHWSEAVAVTVETNGHTVVRSKGKENLYQLDGETFKAFGTAVPDAITAAFGFADVNLQAQMDAPFLLSASPGEVARYLNGIMGLDAIDNSLAGISSEARQVSRDLRQAEQDVAASTEQLAALDWVDAALAELEQAQRLQEELEAVVARREVLVGAVQEIQGLEIIEVPDLTSDFFAVEELSGIITSITAKRVVLETVVAELQALQEVVVPDLGFNFRKIEELQGIIKEKDSRRQLLETVVAEELVLSQQLAALNLAVFEKEEQVRAAAPRVCPTCGQEIPA